MCKCNCLIQLSRQCFVVEPRDKERKKCNAIRAIPDHGYYRNIKDPTYLHTCNN